MTMKALQCRNGGGVLAFVIHLDTTKLLPDGVTPDPAWAFSCQFLGIAAGAAQLGITQSAYTAQCVAEVKLLAAQALAVKAVSAPAVVVAVEGTTW